MTDANPFDDLGAVEDDSDDTVEGSNEPVVESTDAPTSPESSSDQGSDRTEESSAPVSGPSFDYSEVRQRPLYARGETWDEFEDAIGISVVPELRREGIRDEEKREIHDAVLSLAAEEPERIVELIIERRRDPER
ncbi:MULTISPECIES: hypothetical protein [unclassified Haladaptatus]|uniref:hypothetical protein n=1 Tax=unclassified Haladaptatus TaxID=2622732 RepID=UPI00209BF00D|nr:MULTISPECIES: hypothetical protein [unclassified Haladaptatus]MCO8243765.1 hypothetical protein [Haladaptatus sp. AB643]MCO8256706.1 hypothetical protein [Haladaptatus sp. AB618]